MDARILYVRNVLHSYVNAHVFGLMSGYVSGFMEAGRVGLFDGNVGKISSFFIFFISTNENDGNTVIC